MNAQIQCLDEQIDQSNVFMCGELKPRQFIAANSIEKYYELEQQERIRFDNAGLHDNEMQLPLILSVGCGVVLI